MIALFSFFLDSSKDLKKKIISIAELVTFPRAPTNEANAEIETHTVTAEMKIRKCSK